MPFDNVAGQSQAKLMIQQALRNGTLSHAYLLSGPKGTGKTKFALETAKAVFCRESADDSCGACAECRKVEHGNHPYVQYIEPDGQSVKIDQIRNLQKLLAYKTGDQPKVYILNQADRLTTEAANSLLKFLEEPQSSVVALLVTDNPRALLPTIRSRVQTVPFHPMPPSWMAQQLEAEGHPRILVRPAVQLASGLDSAREIIQKNGFAEIRNLVIQLGKESLSAFTVAHLTVHQRLLKSDAADQADVVLDMLLLWYKDCVQALHGHTEALTYSDQEDWLRKHAIAKPLSYWVGCMEHTLECKKRIRMNVNPALAWDQWIYRNQGG